MRLLFSTCSICQIQLPKKIASCHRPAVDTGSSKTLIWIIDSVHIYHASSIQRVVFVHIVLCSIFCALQPLTAFVLFRSALVSVCKQVVFNILQYLMQCFMWCNMLYAYEWYFFCCCIRLEILMQLPAYCSTGRQHS